MPTKVDIEAEIGRRFKDMQDIVAEAKAKNDGMVPGEDMTRWNEHATKVKELKAQLKAQSDVDSFMASGIGGVDKPQGGGGQKSGGPEFDDDGRLVWDGTKRLSELVVGSENYKRLMAGFPGGRPSKDHRVSMDPLYIKSVREPSRKALVTGLDATSAGSLVWPQFEGLSPYWNSYQKPLVVRQLFSQATTETDTIEYVRITSVTNNAAARAEATSSAAPVLPATFSAGGALVNVAGGGYSAESAMVFERDTVLVQDFAHFMPVTKRALADAGQIQSQVDIFLGYGLEATLETQFLTGNGTAPNLAGINAVSGIQTLDQNALPGSAPADPFIATRKARTLIRINAHTAPTAYLVHPSDWEGMDLQRSGVYQGGSTPALTNIVGAGNFLGAGPFETTQPRLWGLPVVESENVTPGTCWVAAWNRATVYDRQSASIQMTDSHADFFVRGLVAILAEERVAFAVLHPQAFLKITNFNTQTSVGSGTTY